MGDPKPLNDYLLDFCLDNCPALLEHEELYDALLKFINAICQKVKRQERETVTKRALTPSRN